MRTIITTIAAAAAAAAAISVATSALAAPRKPSKPSECRGLEQPACSANPVCKWQAARVAGETLTAKGTKAKRSTKAHCRKGPTRKTEQNG